ncbi:MAG: hypothetical protein IRY85_13105, partial [Micromonosporaceae bacterium]|nr:hypothetical protein [Micromonosporaceae bacterium]
MRTRAQAWAIRAAVVAVVTAAGVGGIAGPAHAAPEVSNFGLSATVINPGQQVTATWTVYTRNANGESATVRIEADNPQVECSGDCSRGDVPIGQDGVDFTATFTANGVFASDTRVKVRIYLNNTPWSTVQEFTVRATPTVPEVRGTVTDVYTGEPVKDARVTMIDSAGTTWDNIGTGADGSFSITGTPQKPIAAGVVRFLVRKDGIRDFDSKDQFRASPNVALTGVSLRVEVITTATPTSEQPPPTETEEATTDATTSVAASAPPDSGLSGFAITMIVIGGLLVLTGVGAIVLLFVRKNDDEEDDGPPGPGGRGYGGRGGPGRGGPPPPPGQRRPPGPPDRTQPMRPAYGPRPGAPGARDQTLIARS